MHAIPSMSSLITVSHSDRRKEPSVCPVLSLIFSEQSPLISRDCLAFLFLASTTSTLAYIEQTHTATPTSYSRVLELIAIASPMSAGPALLIESPHQQYFEQLGGVAAGHHYSNNVEMENSNNNSAFSDEDLIASLAGFAVEGQTERDLATIKAMLLSQHHQFPSSGNQFTHNSFNSSAGNGGGIWPMQSPAAATSAWSAFNWNPASGQPPPNTPNLSKSLELYGSSANGNNLNNEYFSSSARRRDVSLERPHFFNTSTSGRGASSTRHGRSSSITSSNRGDNNSTPGSSLSTGFDMDMGEDEVVQEEQEEVIAGPSNGSNTFNGYRPAAAAAVDGGQGYSAGGHNHNGMEDIQEDSMRESLEDAQQHQQQQYQQQQAAPYPAQSSHHHQSSSSANINFDNRHAGIAGQSPPSLPPSLTTMKQWNSNGSSTISSRRSNTSTPTLASSNGHSISRPNSSNSTSSASSPPQTRSRSRQQAQAQAQAANQLRFTSP